MVTHETFIAAVAAIAVARLSTDEQAKLAGIKLVYGSGPAGTRGVTFYKRWQSDKEVRPFVEISAFGQESIVQFAGTTIHELAHVLAGWDAGHGPDWKAACERLGLRCVKAAGTDYKWAAFDRAVRFAIRALSTPTEGQPVASLGGLPFVAKPCGAGIGTKGGKSRGKGSGSRLRLWQCGCGCKVRVASDAFEAVHTPCETAFKQA